MTALGIVKSGSKVDARKMVRLDKPKPEPNKTLTLLLGKMK